MAQIRSYPKEREERFDRRSRTFFTFRSAPMTVPWGDEDPVAVVAVAERVEQERPHTDRHEPEGVVHRPSIEVPDVIGDAIIARLDRV